MLPMQANYTMFYKQSTERKLTIFIIYVDDIILTRDDKEELEGLKIKLAHEFKIKDFGPQHCFLLIEVARTTKVILVTQQKYTLDLLKKTSMTNCKHVATLIELINKLGLEQNQCTSGRGRYQRLVRRLIYFSYTALDIAFTISLVSQF